MAYKSSGNSRGGAPNGSGLGLSTGNTIYGNTAFGPAGGMATGYATASRGGDAGFDIRSSFAKQPQVGPQTSNYSNFRNTSGGAMWGDARQGMSANGTNAGQAFNQINNARVVPTGATTKPAGVKGGIGDIVAPPELPPTLPPAVNPGLAFRYNNVLAPGMYPGNYWKNPTSARRDLFNPNRPDPIGGFGSAGSVSGAPGLGSINGSVQYKSLPGQTQYKNTGPFGRPL